MRFDNLQAWLSWQEQLHPNPIDLGLERVKRVLEALKLTFPPYRIITVGGTNGKGSSVAFAEAILRAGGYRVGAYTSPHILRYNERIRVEGTEVSDQELCDSFARIDTARGEVSLTYFEFGFLAAIDIFAVRGVEAAVLEVGLGGRLDAVNAVDPDAALVTSVGLDHMDWLGPDRESIGLEKAGIYRRGRPAVCGDRSPPASLLQHAGSIGAHLAVLGRDFDWRAEGERWTWRGPGEVLRGLPRPSLPGLIQYDNAATVLTALRSLQQVLPLTQTAIQEGLRTAEIIARFQRIPGEVECILDVAHNPDAARVLADNLRAWPVTGRTYGVMGMFRDKAAEEVALALAPHLDRWYLGGIEGPRGQSAADLATRVHQAVPEALTEEHPTVTAAYGAAHRQAAPGDRLVIFGSFQTVAAVLKDF
ncbi:MAG: bifunctional tetrahydrofolate synthase/dihydrofolate synthase [Gammaproteobacteria bacterium]